MHGELYGFAVRRREKIIYSFNLWIEKSVSLPRYAIDARNPMARIIVIISKISSACFFARARPLASALGLENLGRKCNLRRARVNERADKESQVIAVGGNIYC